MLDLGLGSSGIGKGFKPFQSVTGFILTGFHGLLKLTITLLGVPCSEDTLGALKSGVFVFVDLSGSVDKRIDHEKLYTKAHGAECDDEEDDFHSFSVKAFRVDVKYSVRVA